MKVITLGVRVSSEKEAEVKRIAKLLDVPYSQILREGLDAKLSELRRTHPKLKDLKTVQING